MTRIYEDYPELFDASEDGRVARIELIQNLTKERLEAYEREDILKLAQLTGQSLDTNLPLPMLREKANDLLDNIEVWQSTVILKDSDHSYPTFEFGTATNHEYQRFLKHTGWYVKRDDTYVIENVGYLDRYEAIRDQALCVLDWAIHGDYLKTSVSRYVSHSTIKAWDDATADKSDVYDDKWTGHDEDIFLGGLKDLPDDLFDLIVLSLVTDCEAVASKMVEARQSGRYDRFFERGWVDKLNHKLARDSDYQTKNFLDKIMSVGLSRQFTEAWAKRLASSSSAYCRAGAAHSACPSILTQLNMEGDDEPVREALAGNPSTPVDALKQFVHDGAPKVRAALASHCDMRMDCFQPLASDEDDRVIEQVLSNPSTSDDLFAGIVNKCMEQRSYYVLADNPRVSVDVFRKIDLDGLDDEDPLRVTLAGNAAVPSDVLDKLFDGAYAPYHRYKEESDEVEANYRTSDDEDGSGESMSEEEKRRALDELDTALAALETEDEPDDLYRALRDSKEYFTDVLTGIIWNPSASDELLKKIKSVCDSEDVDYGSKLNERLDFSED